MTLDHDGGTQVLGNIVIALAEGFGLLGYCEQFNCNLAWIMCTIITVVDTSSNGASFCSCSVFGHCRLLRCDMGVQQVQVFYLILPNDLIDECLIKNL